MMRVEINMGKSIRGLVSQYANEKHITMPEAYKQLIINGLVVSDVEFPAFRPDVDIDDELVKAASVNKDDYRIVFEDAE
ncbi:MAG: hypothetical protein J07AB43_01420 [Candidatus Nanosalina sp. J07AB43]|jgi:hypothetical protein|nr:MAG: hypothetical protein J07AB43_01380 [Candidatus Nanosalina sp. J07AB43]EGQ44083.1 MAG: hypothetical protein J07AB43_01420 [Candidatus Nanosalina sp. J07AB43]